MRRESRQSGEPGLELLYGLEKRGQTFLFKLHDSPNAQTTAEGSWIARDDTYDQRGHLLLPDFIKLPGRLQQIQLRLLALEIGVKIGHPLVVLVEASPLDFP